jgi:hypothetical protein
VSGHDDVWMTTAGDIAEWFLAHHYDEFVAHAQQLAGDQGAALRSDRAG